MKAKFSTKNSAVKKSFKKTIPQEREQLVQERKVQEKHCLVKRIVQDRNGFKTTLFTKEKSSVKEIVQ